MNRHENYVIHPYVIGCEREIVFVVDFELFMRIFDQSESLVSCTAQSDIYRTGSSGLI